MDVGCQGVVSQILRLILGGTVFYPPTTERLSQSYVIMYFIVAMFQTTHCMDVFGVCTHGHQGIYDITHSLRLKKHMGSCAVFLNTCVHTISRNRKPPSFSYVLVCFPPLASSNSCKHQEKQPVEDTIPEKRKKSKEDLLIHRNVEKMPGIPSLQMYPGSSMELPGENSRAENDSQSMWTRDEASLHPAEKPG